jgi:hypothetical protein
MKILVAVPCLRAQIWTLASRIRTSHSIVQFRRTGVKSHNLKRQSFERANSVFLAKSIKIYRLTRKVMVNMKKACERVNSTFVAYRIKLHRPIAKRVR